MIQQFLEMYGMEILYLIVSAVLGYIGLQAKKIYEQYINTKEKQAVAKTVCEAIQQLYKDLNGDEKKQKAIENISAILSEKGISITELEMEMLIESAVFSFKQGFTGKVNDSEKTVVSTYEGAVAAALKGETV